MGQIRGTGVLCCDAPLTQKFAAPTLPVRRDSELSTLLETCFPFHPVLYVKDDPVSHICVSFWT